MKTTMTLAANMNCSPFEIFDREVDEVITIINFYIELAAIENSNESITEQKETRIRVNDKTATGGWF